MSNSQRVLLSSIKTLTFFDGEKTTHRRTSPINQLTCTGAACHSYRPDVIQCYNQGGSGADIQWKCEADLPSKLKLGRVSVGCEGWQNSDDPYILKGSCGLTYTLKRINSSNLHDSQSGDLSMTALLFWTLFGVVALFIIYPFIRSILTHFLPSLDPYLPGSSTSSGGGSGGRPGGGEGGGGGGWGGWGSGGSRGSRFWGSGRPGDPPPPYTPRQPPPKATSQTENQPWRPGFWTGLAAGTAATHLFGNRQERPLRDEWSMFGARPTGFGTGSWFGGRPSFGEPRTTYMRQGSSRDLDDSNNLGPLRSSTGFGSTRNR